MKKIILSIVLVNLLAACASEPTKEAANEQGPRSHEEPQARQLPDEQRPFASQAVPSATAPVASLQTSSHTPFMHQPVAHALISAAR